MSEVAVFREVRVALTPTLRQRLSPVLRHRSLLLIEFLAFLCLLVLLQVFAVRFGAGQLILREQVHAPSFPLPLLPRATDTQIIAFRDALVHLPYVKGVMHQTREQAYEEEAKRHADVVAFLEGANLQNPFTDTITVQLASQAEIRALREFLQRGELQSVLNPVVHARIRAAEDEMRAQGGRNRSARVALFGAALVLLLFFLFLSLLTALLRLQHDRQAVILQSLAGAPPVTIARLFFLETMTLCGVALLVASVLAASLVLSLPQLFLPGVPPHLLGAVRSSLFSIGIPIVLLEFLLLCVAAAGGIAVAVRMTVRREEMVA